MSLHAHRMWFGMMDRRRDWILEHLSWAQTEMDYYSTAPNKHKRKYYKYKHLRFVLQHDLEWIESVGIVRAPDNQEILVMNWEELIPEPKPVESKGWAYEVAVALMMVTNLVIWSIAAVEITKAIL